MKEMDKQRGKKEDGENAQEKKATSSSAHR
jgi:hypothetical protein